MDEYHFKKVADGLRNGQDKKGGKKGGEKKTEITSRQASENLAVTTSSAVIEELPDDYPGDSHALMAFEKYSRLPDGWYIDSEATDHMCYDRTLFTDYQTLQTPRPVFLGNSSRVDAHGVETVNLGNRITLTGVLHVPDMELNLFSVEKALCR